MRKTSGFAAIAHSLVSNSPPRGQIIISLAEVLWPLRLLQLLQLQLQRLFQQPAPLAASGGPAGQRRGSCQQGGAGPVGKQPELQSVQAGGSREEAGFVV